MQKKIKKLSAILLSSVMAFGLAGGIVASKTRSEEPRVQAAASYSFSGDTLTFSNQGLSNGIQYKDHFTNGVYEVWFTGGGNTGKYYTSDSSIRIYKTESAVIHVQALGGADLESIKLTFVSENYGIASSSVVSVGSLSTGATSTWTGSANEVEFKLANDSGASNKQWRPKRNYCHCWWWWPCS